MGNRAAYVGRELREKDFQYECTAVSSTRMGEEASHRGCLGDGAVRHAGSWKVTGASLRGAINVTRLDLTSPKTRRPARELSACQVPIIALSLPQILGGVVLSVLFKANAVRRPGLGLDSTESFKC